jgi:methylenetetrahydrofolate dehydrogenase (NADP+) / methenyltetrahydrofolate cyclohydrolase
MIINGNKLADEIEQELREVGNVRGRTLSVLCVGEDPVSVRYIARKVAFGERVGVRVVVEKIDNDISTEELVTFVTAVSQDSAVDGIIVQLPLPRHVDSEQVLSTIAQEKDVDALGTHPLVFPPVVGAIVEVLKRHKVVVGGKKVVVIGRGRLVGTPVAQWADRQGADVFVATSHTQVPVLVEHLQSADVVIAGAGVPNLVKPHMVREGVVLIDAGTSESARKLVGDIDLACAERASLFTPVPGGIGPMTVALLFRNLALLSHNRLTS